MVAYAQVSFLKSSTRLLPVPSQSQHILKFIISLNIMISKDPSLFFSKLVLLATSEVKTEKNGK